MLAFLSIVYLAIPYFLFAWGWLRWPYALGLSLILLAALGLCYRRIRRIERLRWTELFPGGWLNGVFVTLVTLWIVVPTGSGALGPQRQGLARQHS